MSLISLNTSMQLAVTQWELTAVTELWLGTEVTSGTEHGCEMPYYRLGPSGTILLIYNANLSIYRRGG